MLYRVVRKHIMEVFEQQIVGAEDSARAKETAERRFNLWSEIDRRDLPHGPPPEILFAQEIIDDNGNEADTD